MDITPLSLEHVAGCLVVAESLPEWFGYPGALQGIEAALRRETGFVVLDEGEVAAFVSTAPTYRESLEITYLAVHAARRRSGLGHRLIAHVRDAAKAGGFSSVCLLTLGPSASSPFYAQTVAFYQAVGFWRIKELHLSEWNGAPALLMAAPLGNLA
jgi:N-acetylglutamate synthase-like GNAT family acetyltransferase